MDGPMYQSIFPPVPATLIGPLEGSSRASMRTLPRPSRSSYAAGGPDQTSIQQQSGYPDGGPENQGSPPPYTVEDTEKGTCYFHAKFDPSVEDSNNRFQVERWFDSPATTLDGPAGFQSRATLGAIRGSSLAFNSDFSDEVTARRTQIEKQAQTVASSLPEAEQSGVRDKWVRMNCTRQLSNKDLGAWNKRWQETVSGIVDAGDRLVDGTNEVRLKYMDPAAWEAADVRAVSTSAT
jgi:hypothetical protein